MPIKNAGEALIRDEILQAPDHVATTTSEIEKTRIVDHTSVTIHPTKIYRIEYVFRNPVPNINPGSIVSRDESVVDAS
jgi:hypothetical protein